MFGAGKADKGQQAERGGKHGVVDKGNGIHLQAPGDEGHQGKAEGAPQGEGDSRGIAVGEPEQAGAEHDPHPQKGEEKEKNVPGIGPLL